MTNGKEKTTGEQEELHYKETDYGFEYGAAKVNRLCSDKRRGWVVLGVESQKTGVQIYITKTGKIRVFGKGEWKRPEDAGHLEKKIKDLRRHIKLLETQLSWQRW